MAELLFSIHAMGAGLIQCPELIIAEKEAVQIASAISRVTSFYSDAVMPEEVIIWTNLIGTLGMVYIPRAIAISNRKKAGAQRRPTLVETRPAAPANAAPPKAAAPTVTYIPSAPIDTHAN